MILGTISAYTSGTGVALTIDGESTPTTKKYLFLSSYTPVVDDRVLIEEIAGTYVVLGSVVSAPVAIARADVATLAHRVRQYSNTAEYIEFTYFNNNLWAKINGGSQFAIMKKE